MDIEVKDEVKEREEAKKSIEALWDKVWAGGLANPLTAIEQLSYLIFLKRLEQQDIRLREQAIAAGTPPPVSHFDEKEECRWSHLRGLQRKSERLQGEANQLRREAKRLETVSERLLSESQQLSSEVQRLQLEAEQLVAAIKRLEIDSNQLQVENQIELADEKLQELKVKAQELRKKKRQAEDKQKKADANQEKSAKNHQQAKDNREQATEDETSAIEFLEEAFRLMGGAVFDFLKGLDAGVPYHEAMTNAVFLIPTPTLLKSVMAELDTLLHNNDNLDLQGDVYEELLSKLNTSGINGQFRTPRHIIRALIALAKPQVGESISDPAAGTAGFLVEAYKYMVENQIKPPSGEMPPPADGLLQQSAADQLTATQRSELVVGNHLVGYDIDATMARLGLFNLLLHGVTQPQFHYMDTLSARFDEKFGGASYDVILANPPFAGRIDRERKNRSRAIADSDTDASELLFVERCLTLLRQDADRQGRCAMIVPEGVLFGSSGEHLALRQRLLEDNQLNAVVSLPSGAFLPYTGVKTAILFFQRGNLTMVKPRTKVVWFYEVSGSGFTLNARQQPEPGKDNLKGMAEQYYRWVEQGRPEGEFITGTAWTAHYDVITAQSYNLSGNLYRPAQQLSDAPKLNPRVLLQQVREKEATLAATLTELDRLMQQAGIPVAAESGNA